MSNDEAVRVVTGWLYDRDRCADFDTQSRDLLSKLSRLEQSRVERAVDVARKAHARYYQGSVECELLEEIIAILTAQDSSAGSAEAKARDVDASQSVEPGGRSSPPPAAPAEQVCLIRAGYCACGPDRTTAKTPGGVTYCSRCGCGVEADPPAEPSPRIELLDVPINDHKPTLNPPADVKPSRLRTAQAALENLPDGDPSDDEIRGIRIALWQLYYYLDEQHARGWK